MKGNLIIAMTLLSLVAAAVLLAQVLWKYCRNWVRVQAARKRAARDLAAQHRNGNELATEPSTESAVDQQDEASQSLFREDGVTLKDSESGRTSSLTDGGSSGSI